MRRREGEYGGRESVGVAEAFNEDIILHHRAMFCTVSVVLYKRSACIQTGIPAGRPDPIGYPVVLSVTVPQHPAIQFHAAASCVGFGMVV